MKNFLEHLTQVQKTYEFRIKVADIEPTEYKDRLKTALDAYGLESLSEAKRLPIKESDIDFPSLANCQIYLMDAVLHYPVTEATLRAIISERAGIPQGNLFVVPAGHPEEQWRWDRANSDLREYKQGEAVLDKPYEDDPEGTEAGKAYAEKRVLFKDLDRTKWEQAGTDKTIGGEADPAYGKTTNDQPTGELSPVGSKQNTIPSPVKGN